MMRVLFPDRWVYIHFNASYVCRNSAQVLKTILKTGQYTKFSLILFCRYKKYRQVLLMFIDVQLQVFLIVNIIIIIYQIDYKHGHGCANTSGTVRSGMKVTPFYSILLSFISNVIRMYPCP